jgi:hypothetical protein
MILVVEGALTGAVIGALATTVGDVGGLTGAFVGEPPPT